MTEAKIITWVKVNKDKPETLPDIDDRVIVYPKDNNGKKELQEPFITRRVMILGQICWAKASCYTKVQDGDIWAIAPKPPEKMILGKV